MSCTEKRNVEKRGLYRCWNSMHKEGERLKRVSPRREEGKAKLLKTHQRA